MQDVGLVEKAATAHRRLLAALAAEEQSLADLIVATNELDQLVDAAVLIHGGGRTTWCRSALARVIAAEQKVERLERRRRAIQIEVVVVRRLYEMVTVGALPSVGRPWN